MKITKRYIAARVMRTGKVIVADTRKTTVKPSTPYIIEVNGAPVIGATDASGRLEILHGTSAMKIRIIGTVLPDRKLARRTRAGRA